MFGNVLRRLSRRPWSLALVAGLVVLVVAAIFMASAGQGDLFGAVPIGLPPWEFNIMPAPMPRVP